MHAQGWGKRICVFENKKTGVSKYRAEKPTRAHLGACATHLARHKCNVCHRGGVLVERHEAKARHGVPQLDLWVPRSRARKNGNRSKNKCAMCPVVGHMRLQRRERGRVGMTGSNLAVVTPGGNQRPIRGVRQGVQVMKVALLLQHVCSSNSEPECRMQEARSGQAHGWHRRVRRSSPSKSLGGEGGCR